MSISTVLVRVMVDAVERSGASRDEFLRSLKIDPARLSEADGRFELEEFARLEERALDVTRDEAFGLHVAERVLVTAFGLMSHLTSHAPTMREAFGLITQFRRLLMDDCYIRLTEAAGAATIQYEFTRSLERADRMHAEFVVTALLQFARAFGGPNLVRWTAAFEHPRPAHYSEYVRIFGEAVRFDQPATAFTFDRALLDWVQLHHQPELFVLLRSQAQRALERAANELGTTDRVKQYLVAHPPARIPDLKTAARDLGLSTRSLRRLLTTEGTSYRSLVRSVRQTYADLLLRDPKRSIQETASALGFATVRAFHQAFKQWTGMTPGEYRGRREIGPTGSD